MQSYPINELERLTGVKAHTLRIWEKRYGIITPERTSTNRRYYSDDQVRKLLNVTTLMGMGYKISKIAELSEKEITEAIQHKIAQDPKNVISAGYINGLVSSMLAFDEHGFETIFAAAATRLGMYEAILQVVYPFLNKVGMLWSVDKAAPVQEHFAASIVRRKLMAATDGLLPASKKDKRFLLFLPPGEWHDLGLLFANYVIRMAGYDTVYLGQNVPIEQVSSILPGLKPSYLLTFYIVARPKTEVESHLKQLAGSSVKTEVLVAGNADLLKTNKAKIKNVTYLMDVKGLQAFF